MPEQLPLLRFIPFRQADILPMCLADGQLSKNASGQLKQVCYQIEEHFQREFHNLRNDLKKVYASIDPDADTRQISRLDPGDSSGIAQMLGEVLNRANYEKVTETELIAALGSSSLFQVRLYIDLNEFEEVLLYTRGATRRQEVLREFFGLWRRTVNFTNYDRVFLFIRYKQEFEEDATTTLCKPGATMLKLFQNVPEADLEMLFPNVRVGMRWIDRLMIGVPALVGGGVVFTTKLSATLLLLSSLVGFWMGLSHQPVNIDKTALLALVASVGALVGYAWKQFSNFRNRKLRYTQALTENLYFKLLDNNAGALLRVLDEAESSEIKESELAYYFLLLANGPVSAETIDQNIEQWLARRWQCRVNFEIEDALQKLSLLGLVRQQDGMWQPVTAASAKSTLGEL